MKCLLNVVDVPMPRRARHKDRVLEHALEHDGGYDAMRVLREALELSSSAGEDEEIARWWRCAIMEAEEDDSTASDQERVTRDPAPANLSVDDARNNVENDSEDDDVRIDKCIDDVVDKLGYSAAMRALIRSKEAIGMPKYALLAALQSTNGLAHPARRILQEQHRQREPQGSE